MISAPRDMWGSEMFQLLYDQVGRTRALELLGVSPRLLSRWLSGASEVPRCAVLALYWESKWGRSVIASDHHFEVSNLHGMVECLRREIRALWERIAFLESGAHYCANDNFFECGSRPQDLKVGEAFRPKHDPTGAAVSTQLPVRHDAH
jgi:hypothetical protein